jgi:ankyrin repeat protein
VNNLGNTLLHEVARDYKSGDGEQTNDVIKQLLKIGVSPELRNNLGQTALHLACSSLPGSLYGNKSDPLDLFLGPEFVATINTEDYHGIRPIHLAASISEQVVARLIQCGADATLLTDEGKNVLHIAARLRQSNVVGLVLDHLKAISRVDIVSDTRGSSTLILVCFICQKRLALSTY